MADTILEITNGECIPRSSIPELSGDSFQTILKDLCREKGRIVQYFAYEDKAQLRLLAIVRTDRLFVLGTAAPESFSSLTEKDAKFNLFERELAEQYGIIPRHHPWLKSVRFHPNYRGAPDVFGQSADADIPGNYPYYRVEGDDVHQVGVGPVHAGVIEPGHFRFNCIGETVLHLEIHHGYQHRGVEPLLVRSSPKRWPVIVEGIAGDTTIGNSTCFARAVESLWGFEADDETRLIRCLALELERIANHVGDLGALSGDVAFLPPSAYFGRIRGEFLNLLLLLSGNRFGKGLMRPGKSHAGSMNRKLELVQQKCAELKIEIEQVSELLFNSASVLSRFEETGVVSNLAAKELGLVGVAARASGIGYDVRSAFPFDYYLTHPLKPIIEQAGDVHARARIRHREILQSLEIIAAMKLKPSDVKQLRAPFRPLAPDSLVVTLTEGWRGELAHTLLTDSSGKLIRYKIKDPSFHNWNGLAQALRGGEISDFPLCNKSFNLSYCGIDL